MISSAGLSAVKESVMSRITSGVHLGKGLFPRSRGFGEEFAVPGSLLGLSSLVAVSQRLPSTPCSIGPSIW